MRLTAICLAIAMAISSLAHAADGLALSPLDIGECLQNAYMHSSLAEYGM